MKSQGNLDNIFLNAIIDGCTGAALFGRLRWLGAPKEIVDSRTVDEYIDSDDFLNDIAVAQTFELRDEIRASARAKGIGASPGHPRSGIQTWSRAE
jgi:hypothetical protein